MMNNSHSRHIVLTVFSSSVSEKIRIFFIFSNSSYSECVRKDTYNSLSNEAVTYTKCINDNGTISLCEGTIMATGKQTVSESTTFTSCTFTSLSSTESGGAISCRVSNTKLSLFLCIFDHCSSTGEGGAIVVNGITELSVGSSTFFSCVGRHITGDYSGGGGIMIRNLVGTVSLDSSCFISCNTTSDGGAISIYSCTLTSMEETICSKSNRFISCHSVPGGNSPAGGGCHDSVSDRVLGILNCLFTSCTTTFSSGAVYMDKPATLPYPVMFSFFCNNYGKNDGNDVYFGTTPSKSPLLYCFSTTQNNRIHPTGHDNNWLSYVCN